MSQPPLSWIDAHQHFWEPRRRFPLGGSWFSGALTYGWSEAGLPELDRPFLPADLDPHRDAAGVARTIAVQAINSDGETRWLLDLAAGDDRIAGVVGWLDLARPAELVDQELEALAGTKLVGVRHLAEFERDPRWLVRRDVVASLEVLARRGIPFDLEISARELEAARQLSDRLPELRMVVDHLGKPPIRDQVREPWAGHLRAFAANPRLSAKVSGLVTEADHQRWTPADLRPYLDAALEAFGPDRLLFGSDWPVCTVAATYAQVVDALRRNLQELGAGDATTERAIFHDAAARFYGLGGTS